MTHSNVETLMGKSSEKLGNLASINFKMRIWSGKLRLSKEEESETTGGDIIESKYKELGNKVIADPKGLTEFASFKSSVETWLDQYGPKFQGTWIVNKDDLPDILAELESRIRAFDLKADGYARTFHLKRQNWLANDEELNKPKNLKLKQVIAGVDLTEAWVRNRFQAHVHVPLEVRPVNLGDDSMFEEHCDQIINDVTESVFNDVAKKAQEILSIWNNKTRIPWKQKSTKVYDLRTTLYAARFIDKAAKPLVIRLDQVLNMLEDDPKYIEGITLNKFLAVFNLIADPEKAKTFTDGMMVLEETEQSVNQQQSFLSNDDDLQEDSDIEETQDPIQEESESESDDDFLDELFDSSNETSVEDESESTTEVSLENTSSDSEEDIDDDFDDFFDDLFEDDEAA